MAIYNDQLITIDEKVLKLDVVNAKTTERIVLEVQQNLGKFGYKIWDCKGNMVHEKEINLDQGLHSFTVPASGIISFNRSKIK